MLFFVLYTSVNSVLVSLLLAKHNSGTGQPLGMRYIIFDTAPQVYLSSLLPRSPLVTNIQWHCVILPIYAYTSLLYGVRTHLHRVCTLYINSVPRKGREVRSAWNVQTCMDAYAVSVSLVEVRSAPVCVFPRLPLRLAMPSIALAMSWSPNFRYTVAPWSLETGDLACGSKDLKSKKKT